MANDDVMRGNFSVIYSMNKSAIHIMLKKTAFIKNLIIKSMHKAVVIGKDF